MGYFYGGDGKSVTRYDLRNAAGFARDAGIVMTNFLLPVKVTQASAVLCPLPLSADQKWPLDLPTGASALSLTCRTECVDVPQALSLSMTSDCPKAKI